MPAGLWKKLVAVQVYGANTDVGKTVFSTLLGKRFRFGPVKDERWHVQYIKPVSTGPQSDRDDASVRPSPNDLLKLLTRASYVRMHSGCSAVHTLFQFQNPVSPHIAAREVVQDPKDIVRNYWTIRSNFVDNGSQTMGRSMLVSAEHFAKLQLHLRRRQLITV